MDLLPARLRSGVVTGKISDDSISVAGAWASRLTIWASAKNGLRNDLATIQDGSCQETMVLSLWLRLLINVSNTIFLAASNEYMQCLSCPTLEEVDRAHSRHIWLDIEVPNVRNPRRIVRGRIVLWWLLAFSGKTLHLLYNSAVFSTLSSQQYTAYIVADELVNGVGMNSTASNWVIGLNFAKNNLNTSDWHNLTSDECIQAYRKPLVSDRSDAPTTERQ